MFSFRSFFQFNLRHKGRNKIANFSYIDMYLQLKKKKKWTKKQTFTTHLIFRKINSSGSRISMTSKTELNVVVPNDYQPLDSSWCPKSPGIALDKILLLSDESLFRGRRQKKIPYWLPQLTEQSQLSSWLFLCFLLS